MLPDWVDNVRADQFQTSKGTCETDEKKGKVASAREHDYRGADKLECGGDSENPSLAKGHKGEWISS